MNTTYKNKQYNKEYSKYFIYVVSISARADSRINTEFTRGVFGGERKRTCIGIELVLQPKILFLDELTTDFHHI